MNKLEMAHEFGKAVLSNPTVKLNAETLKQIVSNSWNYADAMQAEADKREDKSRLEALEGWQKSKTPARPFFKPEDKKEWQPDWSQAPEWANWAAVGSLSNKLIWSVTEPQHINIQGVGYWDVTSPRGEEHKCYSTLTSYTGNWQDSMRKRP